MKDVQEAVYEVKAIYEKSKISKARVWLDKLSSRIMLYGTVLDTLSQHHAEYVSLVWGAIKFVLVVSDHHPIYSSGAAVGSFTANPVEDLSLSGLFSNYLLSRPSTSMEQEIAYRYSSHV